MAELQNILKTKTTIGVLGIGAIGTVMSYILHKQSTHDMFYFNRTKKSHLNLNIEDSSIEIPVAIQTKISAVKHLEWLIICLKEHQYENAKHWFEKLISKDTKVVVIRNGLQLKKPLLKFTSEYHILETIIDCPTQGNPNGVYSCIRFPKLTLPEGRLATQFESLFSTSEISINQVSDFKTESWKKLSESATLGAILCLYNDTCRIFNNEAPQQEYKNLMTEIINVAKADGAYIEADFIDKMLKKLLTYPKTKGSSMLSDLREKKPLELGAKNRIISQLAKQYNVDTPINDDIIGKLNQLTS